MQIDWIPLGEPESFDNKAKLEQLHEAVEEKYKFLEVSALEVDQIVKEFKAVAQEYL
jgi:hypothetical protein